MKIAVMQPYLFPYIGYFQLINAVNTFVFYDDVNFIKQGWVNRNKVLVSGKELMFAVPLKNASSFVSIKDTEINRSLFIKWRTKFLRTLEQSYKKAPNFDEVYTIISEILINDFYSISDLAKKSILKITMHLGLQTNFHSSSELYHDTKILARAERLITIANRNKAITYINPIGGQDLYIKEVFAVHNIQLNFIKAKPLIYKQFENEFVPYLSIIDVLMFNSKEEVGIMLNEYELL